MPMVTIIWPGTVDLFIFRKVTGRCDKQGGASRPVGAMNKTTRHLLCTNLLRLSHVLRREGRAAESADYQAQAAAVSRGGAAVGEAWATREDGSGWL